MNETELIEEAVRGSSQAFEQLVEQHYNLVYRTAYRFCGTQEDAEDIAQEVFVKLAGNMSGFKGKSSFSTWLYRISVNTARDYLKKSSTKGRYEAAYVEEMKTQAQKGKDNPISPEDLYRTLDKLPHKLKEAVILVHAEGLSHRDAAIALGCAETTVSWRLFQARRKLKSLLKREV